MKLFDDVSKEEIRDIVISVVVLTIIFSFPDFTLLPLYFVAVVVAFMLHELAHRYVARKFRCAAYYKIWPMGLVIGLILMFTPLKFVAPGAVVIAPYRFGRWGFRHINLSPKEMGFISLSGPTVNIVFAILFRYLAVTIPWIFTTPYGAINGFLALSLINGWLGLFNMLPLKPLDGSKIMMWKPWVWFVYILLSLLLVVTSPLFL